MSALILNSLFSMQEAQAHALISDAELSDAQRALIFARTLSPNCTSLTEIIAALSCVMPGALSCIFHIPHREE